MPKHPLEKLLLEHCPQGVEFVELGEVCSLLNGYSFKKSDYVEKSNTLLIRMGNIRPNGGFNPEHKPIYLPDSFLEKYKNYALSDGDILIAMSGNNVGMTSLIKNIKGRKLLLNQRVAKPHNLSPNIHVPFLYYVLITQRVKKYIQSLSDAAAQPNLSTASILALKIPLPPLIIQEKIVTILDCFTELSAELSARKKQYSYYLNALLDFGTPTSPRLGRHALLKESFKVEWVELGTIGEFVRGSGLTKADLHPDNPNGELVGAIHYGEIHTFYNVHTSKTKSFITQELAKKLKPVYCGNLVIVGVSENPADVCKAVAYLGQETIYIGGDTFALRHQQNPKYLAYLFQTQAFKDFKLKYTCGAKVSRLNLQDLKTFLIPLPPLALQEKIVEILDQFNALTTDLQQGLPAEIEAREKQYTHYLNALLDFGVATGGGGGKP
ncbi:putative type I restriction-modification system [Helicobacter felis ATCC 49179]|uniref:Type I restriction-modification system n=3 Tax=Helicobacter felis TaxID=214 RepID=E7ABB7_HELFC|nr:putative type I restriction-modification system [Helicobacter felis ATCC 49179]